MACLCFVDSLFAVMDQPAADVKETREAFHELDEALGILASACRIWKMGELGMSGIAESLVASWRASQRMLRRKL